MSASKLLVRICIAAVTLLCYHPAFAAFIGQSSVDGSGGVWREVHCESGSGWQKCQPPPCEAQGVSWGACSSTVPRTLLLGSVTVGNSTPGYSGSATFMCQDYDLYSQWTYVSGSCVEDPPPPPPTPTNPPGGGGTPPSGTRLYVTAFICGASTDGYYSPPAGVSTYWRNRIITNYTNFNIGKRCPELGGYIFWLNDMQSNFDRLGSWDAAWDDTVTRMNQAAKQNGEDQPWYITTTMKAYCTNFARGIYGPSVSASYVMNTGNICVID